MAGRERITWEWLRGRKRAGEKFSVLTCYDYPTARLMAAAGVEVVLVGDTAAETVLGLPSTRDVSFEYMLTITEAVRRGAPDVLLMGDMPYSSGYQSDPDNAVRAARRFVDEAGCNAVKIEVSRELLETVRRVVEAGVSVVAHLGLLPQSIERFGGYKGQGKNAEGGRRILEDAKLFEEAGADAILLEAVSHEVGRLVTERTELPVIGCVAGPGCDGTVVVLHDMLAWGGGHPPRSVKQYARLGDTLKEAFADYVEDIHAKRFPGPERGFRMKPGEYEKLCAAIREKTPGRAG